METSFEKFSNSIEELKTLIDDNYEKVTEPMEIVSINGVITDDEQIKKLEENIVINAGDFSNSNIKRGDIIWISCLMKKPGASYSAQQQGVLKCRVSDIYAGLSKLNSLLK